MFGRLLRHVRDTFVVGSAERRWRRLESETRDLLLELDNAMEKLAMRAATEAKRRSRAAQAALGEDFPLPTAAASPAPEQDLALVTDPEERARIKAQILTRIPAALTPRRTRHEEVG